MKNIALVTLTLFAFVSCNDVKKETVDQSNTDIKEIIVSNKKITVPLEAKSESNAKGVAKFFEKSGKVSFLAKISGLSPGIHAVHLHEKADCSSVDGKSAGGHWNPTFQPHGKWGDASGYHKGDIGNFNVNEDGEGSIALTTNEWCIGCGDKNKDILGKAIIVHQGADDFTSQPSGAAGARVSCGGIIE
ncbi:Copper/Zinc superoxide dismutase [unidentified eubacterium SCB49]|nr:Copper/Zinc superoxide dismutase [unidentified eubacterium SCB49]